MQPLYNVPITLCNLPLYWWLTHTTRFVNDANRICVYANISRCWPWTNIDSAHSQSHWFSFRVRKFEKLLCKFIETIMSNLFTCPIQTKHYIFFGRAIIMNKKQAQICFHVYMNYQRICRHLFPSALLYS